MLANRFVSLGWLKSVLLASAVLAGAAFVGHGTDPAYASHTEILFSKSNTSPTMVASLLFVVGGPSQTVYVWAKNVDDAQGAAAFDVKFTYNHSVATITALTVQSAWLTSTLRQGLACPAPWWALGAPYVRAIPDDPSGLWEGQVSCGTLDPPPTGPAGPSCYNSHCDGLLAIITIAPGALGTTHLDLTWGSRLVDTGTSPPVVDPALIPATRQSLNLSVVRCSDFDGDTAVTIDDISAIALRFLTAVGSPGWNPIYDLDNDLSITIDDISASAMQFLQVCTA